MTTAPRKPERNPAEGLRSRLLQRAQELERLDYIVELYVEGHDKAIPLILAGMQGGGRPPVKKVELDAAEAELRELVEWLFFEQAERLQELLLSPSYFQDSNYVQAYELTREGAPEAPIRALLMGWLIGMGQPHPAVGARILARSLTAQAGPQQGSKKKHSKAKSLN